MDNNYKNLQLTVELHAMLKVLAAQRHMTMIQLVRHLVEKEMENGPANNRV